MIKEFIMDIEVGVVSYIPIKAEVLVLVFLLLEDCILKFKFFLTLELVGFIILVEDLAGEPDFLP